MTRKTTNRSAKLKIIRFFSLFACARERTSTKTHSIESRLMFVESPSDILFAGEYVCTFQPGNLTSWGSEGVNGDTYSRNSLAGKRLTKRFWKVFAARLWRLQSQLYENRMGFFCYRLKCEPKIICVLGARPATNRGRLNV